MIIQSDNYQAELSSGCVGWKVPGGLLGTGRLELSFAEGGGGEQGAWVLVRQWPVLWMAVLRECTLGALRMSAGCLHRWGQDFWGTMEVTGLGGLWEE